VNSASHSGVDPAVGQVGQQVDEDEGEADGEETSLHQGVVAAGDGGDDEAAETGPTEDGFRDDGSGEQCSELQADYGNDGDEGVGQGVAVDYGVFGEAFGSGGADVVVVELFEHGGADHASEDGGEGRAHGYGGQDEVFPAVDGGEGAGACAGDGKPAQGDGEDENQDWAESKGWDG